MILIVSQIVVRALLSSGNRLTPVPCGRYRLDSRANEVMGVGTARGTIASLLNSRDGQTSDRVREAESLRSLRRPTHLVSTLA
jgi:hypothetical protein